MVSSILLQGHCQCSQALSEGARKLTAVLPSYQQSTMSIRVPQLKSLHGEQSFWDAPQKIVTSHTAEIPLQSLRFTEIHSTILPLSHWTEQFFCVHHSSQLFSSSCIYLPRNWPFWKLTSWRQDFSNTAPKPCKWALWGTPASCPKDKNQLHKIHGGDCVQMHSHNDYFSQNAQMQTGHQIIVRHSQTWSSGIGCLWSMNINQSCIVSSSYSCNSPQSKYEMATQPLFS